MTERDDERDEAARPDLDDPDAPATPEEEAASSRLRDALEAGAGGADVDGSIALAQALSAAWSPDPIDPEDHAALVDELPDAAELAVANELRTALEDDGRAEDPLVGALRAAWAPAPIQEEEHRAIVARAVGAAAGAKVIPLAARRARVVRAVAVGTTAVLALAASVLVFVRNPSPKETPLAVARSTQSLFEEPFKPGEASARIDRIALARASDFRDNRFARWGAR